MLVICLAFIIPSVLLSWQGRTCGSQWLSRWRALAKRHFAKNWLHLCGKIPNLHFRNTAGSYQPRHLLSFSEFQCFSQVCVWNTRKIKKITRISWRSLFLACDHCYNISHPHTLYYLCIHSSSKLKTHLNQVMSKSCLITSKSCRFDWFVLGPLSLESTQVTDSDFKNKLWTVILSGSPKPGRLFSSVVK